MTGRASLRIGVLSALCLGFLTPAASAQEPESIPRELAEALVFGGVPGEQCTLHVGEAPPDFTLAWPEGTRILGGSRNPSRMTVVAAVPGDREDATAAVETALEEAKWTALPPPPAFRGGFQSRPSGTEGRTFCSDDGSVRTIHVTKRPSGDALVVIRETRPGERSMTICSRQETRFVPPHADVLPPLYTPEGARTTNLGGGQSDRSVESRVEIRAEAGIEDLLEHFASQLEAAGWERTDDTVSGTTGHISWRFDHAGDRCLGQLYGVEAPEADLRYLTVVANLLPEAE